MASLFRHFFVLAFSFSASLSWPLSSLRFRHGTFVLRYFGSCQRHSADVSIFSISSLTTFAFERFVDFFGVRSFAVVISHGGTIPVLLCLSFIDIRTYIYTTERVSMVREMERDQSEHLRLSFRASSLAGNEGRRCRDPLIKKSHLI